MTDISLLERLMNSGVADQAAWAEFVSRYGGRIYRWCLKWNLQPADAEDVTQIVLTKLVSSMKEFTYDAQGSFRAWLKTVTRNAWQDLLKSQKRGESREKEAAVIKKLTAEEVGENLQTQLTEEFEREVLEIAMQRVRNRVAPQTWQAFYLTAIEGRPAREAGEFLTMGVASVYQARRNVQLKLREEIERLETPSQCVEG